MARFPRVNIANIPQHVIQRGNNHSDCFLDNQDRYYYLKLLKKYLPKCQVKLHGYVLMTNHVHLLMTPAEDDGISKLMQCLGRCYVRYMNDKYQRTGTLWEGRFKSCLVDRGKYFLTVSRYIELNPVRANMVEYPHEYQWSSYKFNALGENNPILEYHSCYLGLAKDDESRQQQYLKLFNVKIMEKSLSHIRDSINKSLVYGEDAFKDNLKRQLHQSIEPGEQGGDRKSQDYMRSVIKHSDPLIVVTK